MTYPADIQPRDGCPCYAAEAANRVAANHRVSVHAMLRSNDSAVAAKARRELVEDLVQRAWRLDAIERWYGMRPGAAAEAMRLPAVAPTPTVPAPTPERPADPSPRMGRPKTRTRPTCPCGAVGPLDGNDRFATARRLAKWGSPEYVCRTCAGLRIRARTDARRASLRERIAAPARRGAA